jgi:Flp pilus assembly pilin Flp
MKNFVKALARVHRCERGAEGLEKLLIIGAIALPLLGVLLYFRKSVTDWVYAAWESMTGKDPGNPAGPPGLPAQP